MTLRLDGEEGKRHQIQITQVTFHDLLQLDGRMANRSRCPAIGVVSNSSICTHYGADTFKDLDSDLVIQMRRVIGMG